MREYQKIWMILAFGLIFIMGSTMVTISAQEFKGEENSIDGEPGPDEYSDGKSGGPQVYSEMFGQFQMNMEDMNGRYVNFSLEDGEVINYTFVPEDELIFSNITFASDLMVEENIRVDGAVFHAEKDGVHFMAHNNPTSRMILTYSGEDWTNISFDLADELSYGEMDEGIIPIVGLDTEAWISPGTEEIDIEEGVLWINVTKDIMVTFHRSPYQTMSSFQEKLARAISMGEVDGEMQVMSREGGTTDCQHFPYEGKVSMQIKGSEEGKMLTIEVQSQESSGKTLMFNVQGKVLGDVEVGKVRIEFDGQKAEKAGSVEEVLNGNASKCQYYLTKDEEGCYQAMVYVPGFSTHDIAFITEDETTDSPFMALGMMLIILSIGSIIGIGAMIGRKR